MFAFQLVLALTSPASAADLHTCAATVSTDTLSVPVSGFGSSEAEARRNARQAARLLADQRLVLESGLAWLGGSAPHAERLASWVKTTGTRSFASPGWTFEMGECSTENLPDAPAFEATWSSGSESLVRVHPADALEASRRRACFPLYQVAFTQTLEKATQSESGVSADSLTPWEGAWNQLAQCYGQEPPKPAASTPMGPDSPGPARCSAIGPDGTAVAQGFGATAERAAEDALQQSVVGRARTLAGEVNRVRAVVDRADRAAELTTLLKRITTFTGASDVIDRARLACSTVTPGPVEWRPKGRMEKDCNSASWTERPRDPVPTDQAGAFLDTTCALQVDPTMQIVRFSLRGSTGDKRDDYVASAFRVASTCEAACQATATWGTDAKPFTLAGVADRTDKRKVVASLKLAAEGSGPPLKGLELLPTAQTPAALGALFSGETWERLKAELPSLASKPERWTQLEGHWIVLPAE